MKTFLMLKLSTANIQTGSILLKCAYERPGVTFVIFIYLLPFFCQPITSFLFLDKQ